MDNLFSNLVMSAAASAGSKTDGPQALCCLLPTNSGNAVLLYGTIATTMTHSADGLFLVKKNTQAEWGVAVKACADA